MIYLASPYSDPDPAVKQERNDIIMRESALLMNAGYLVISPIAASHAIAVKHNLPGDYSYWQRWNKGLIDACSELWVCTMPGWEKSVGVAGEIEYAESKRISIRYYDPEKHQLAYDKDFNPESILWSH